MNCQGWEEMFFSLLKFLSLLYIEKMDEVLFFPHFFACAKKCSQRNHTKGTTDENLRRQIFTRFPLWNPLSVLRKRLNASR